MKFKTGQLLITPGVMGMDIDILGYFVRHMQGDWGDLHAEDKKMNDYAVKNGDDRILSRYNTPDGPIYIITEWTRECTTILKPSEY